MSDKTKGGDSSTLSSNASDGCASEEKLFTPDGVEPPKPDAWYTEDWKSPVKEVGVWETKKEPLFSAETIQDTVKEMDEWAWHCPMGGKTFKKFVENDKKENPKKRCPNCGKTKEDILKQGEFDAHEKLLPASYVKEAFE